MLNVVLSKNDRIEAVLPLVESAMAAGEICRLENMAHLGRFETVTDSLLIMVERLFDGDRSCRAQPGFRLLGVDGQGITRTLML